MLADRYHDLMKLRAEGFQRYGAMLINGYFAPPARISLPSVGLHDPHMPSIKRGPLFFGDNPPVKRLADDALERSERVTVLEIGPGAGTLAAYLKNKHTGKIVRYFGLERDAKIDGPYERIAAVSDLEPNVDLILAAEVAEHMTADDFYSQLILPCAQKLSARGEFIMTVPNPLAPGSIFLDFTHVQAYPWWDLYAILRLAFGDVRVFRTHYVWSARRLATLPLRMALSRLLELDWCEGLACIASRPVAFGSSES